MLLKHNSDNQPTHQPVVATENPLSTDDEVQGVDNGDKDVGDQGVDADAAIGEADDAAGEEADDEAGEESCDSPNVSARTMRPQTWVRMII
jgi:hypothetical protein